MKILISGASGFVGKLLVNKLTERGHSINILTRKKSGKANEFQWSPEKNFIEDAAFEGIECIIHLAGASIAKRWTEDYKKELYSSRINGADLIRNYCEKYNLKLNSFISASGINYYGTFTTNEFLTEETPQRKQDFLAKLSKDWEDAAQYFLTLADKVVCLRTSLVLGKQGGTFPHLKRVTKFNLASPIGTGEQWMNWIHVEDLVNMYVFAVENIEISGSYNAVADETPSNKDFMKSLAAKMNKIFIPIKIPSFLLRLILGEMSSIILEGTRASNKKIKSQGFDFKYGTLEDALENLLR